MPKPRTIRLDGKHGISDNAWELLTKKASETCRTTQDYIRYRLNLIAAEIYVEKEQGK